MRNYRSRSVTTRAPHGVKIYRGRPGRQPENRKTRKSENRKFKRAKRRDHSEKCPPPNLKRPQPELPFSRDPRQPKEGAVQHLTLKSHAIPYYQGGGTGGEPATGTATGTGEVTPAGDPGGERRSAKSGCTGSGRPPKEQPKTPTERMMEETVKRCKWVSWIRLSGLWSSIW